MVAASEQSPASPHGAEVSGCPPMWSVLLGERLAHLGVSGKRAARERGVLVCDTDAVAAVMRRS